MWIRIDILHREQNNRQNCVESSVVRPGRPNYFLSFFKKKILQLYSFHFVIFSKLTKLCRVPNSAVVSAFASHQKVIRSIPNLCKFCFGYNQCSRVHPASHDYQSNPGSKCGVHDVEPGSVVFRAHACQTEGLEFAP
jgi:hypothetical protein